MTFSGALLLACAAWVIVESLKPPRPINHMDVAAALIPLMTAIGFAVLIAFMQVVGVVLGIVGLRQSSRRKWAAQLGIVLSGGGLLCTVIVIAALVTEL